MLHSSPVTSESPNSAAAPQASADPAVQAPQGREFLRQALYGQQAAEPPSGPQAAQPVPVSGKILVDDNGVAREVDVQELLATANQATRARAEAQAIAEAAKAQLVKNAAAQQLLARLEQLDPKHREAALKLLQDPERMLQPATPADPSDPFAPGSAAPQVPPELLDEFNKVKQLSLKSAQVLAELGQERRQQTMSQQVDAVMGELPVFGAIPQGLREATKGAILRDLTANPDAINSVEDLRRIVLNRAREASVIDQQYRAAHGLVPDGRSAPSPGGAPQAQARRFTGKDLLNGGILRAAREAAMQNGMPF